jgi:hypothetical protein
MEITELIEASHGLINTYIALTKRELPQSRLDDAEKTYIKDKAVALTTVNAGRRVAARDVETMLMDRYHEVRGRTGLTKEDERRGRRLMSQGEDEDKENHNPLGWGNVAIDAQKAVRKLHNVGQRA